MNVFRTLQRASTAQLLVGTGALAIALLILQSLLQVNSGYGIEDFLGWTRADGVDFAGEFYKLKLPVAPMRPYQQNGGPLLYFGGYSPDAVELCAEHCDVYLMWPETEPRLAEMMTAVGTAARKHNRTLDYGLRVHMIVRETESEARAYAQQLASKLDPETGKQIRNRSLDSQSYGVARQAEMRNAADDEGYVAPRYVDRLPKASIGKSCVRFKKLADLDEESLVALIEETARMGLSP